MNNRYFPYIAIGITALLIILLNYFVIIPIWKGVSQAKAEKPQKEQQLADLQSQISSLKALQAQKATIESYYQDAETLIPTQPQLGDLLIKTEALLGEAKLSEPTFEVTGLTNTKSGAANSAKTTTQLTSLQAHPLTISGKVTLDQHKALINMLNGMDRLIEITSISLVSGEGSQLQLELTGNAFSQSAQSPTAKQKINATALLEQAEQYLNNRRAYGTPIDIKTETGFGRPNPFIPY